MAEADLGLGSSAADNPPFYQSPEQRPSLWKMARSAFADPASVIPARIYRDWSATLPGPIKTIAFSHPDDVRRVLIDKGETFGRNAQMRTLLRRAWGQGLAAAEGDDWIRQHKAAAPVFRPQAVAGYAPAMVAVVERVAARWDMTAPIPLDAAIGRIVAEIVMCTLLTGLADVDLDQLAVDMPQFVRLVSTFGALDAFPIPARVLDWLRGMGRGAAESRLRAVIARLVTARAQGPDAVHDFPAAMRLVGPMADNFLGTLPAGYETTARAVGWAIYLLARYPEWQDAVRAEALAAGDDFALPVTRQVAQETMRLYPPAPLLVRTAMRTVELRGHTMSKGHVAALPIYAMHRHHALWEQPAAFNPARFAPGSTHDRAAFLPFGAGPRMCIAAQFAMTEIAVIIATLVKRTRFTPTFDVPDVSLVISTHAKNGLWVQAEPA
jgi:cytochrome P450